MENNNQNSSLAPLLLVLLVLSVLAIAWLLYRNGSFGRTPAPVNQSTIIKQETNEFEEISEDETTPEEINNEVLDELDDIMNSVDGDGSAEDLSELGY